MKQLRFLTLGAVLAAAATGAWMIWDSEFERPVASGPWEYEVYATGLDKVDNIVAVADQTLYISLEMSDGQGQIIRLQGGERHVLLDGLHRPDGLTHASDALYVTEETANGRVLRLDPETGETHLYGRFRNPEGIRVLADGNLVISEDVVDSGRVLSVSALGQVDELAEGLDKPEGLDLGADGTIYFAESNTGRILSISEGETRTVVVGLNNPDQISLGPDGAIWITEDRRNGRLLRYLNGRLETVLSNLREPQGIALGDDGWIYVAEQGRDRILRLRIPS